jgi:hypothetical protein
MRKSTIAVGFAALLLAGNVQAASAHAPAKSIHTHIAAVHHIVHHRRVAYARPYSNYAQLIQMMFGEARSLGYAGPLPNVASLHVRRGTHAASGDNSYYDNSTDTSAADSQALTDAQNAQAASDSENQAIQEMNDENALNASMAAAEQQNDAAVAATQQTEINAGN